MSGAPGEREGACVGVESAWDHPRPAALVAREARAWVELGGVRVAARPGDFYGGPITTRVTGPLKGGPGTLGW